MPRRRTRRILRIGAAFLVIGVGTWWAIHRSESAAFDPSAPLGTSFGLQTSAITDNSRDDQNRMPEVLAPAVQGPAAIRAPVQVDGQAKVLDALNAPPEAVLRVRQALEGGDPGAAMEAAAILTQCAHVEAQVNTTFAARDQQSPALMRALNWMGARIEHAIVAAMTVQRHCQMFDAPTIARRGDLYRRAYEGQVQGAAIGYLRWLRESGRFDAEGSLVGKLQGELRTAAEAGDTEVLMAYALAFDLPDLGITPVEKEAYKQAWLRIQAQVPAEAAAPAVLRALPDIMDKLSSNVPLNAEQKSKADDLANRVLAAYLRRRNGT